MSIDQKNKAKIFKAFCDENRLEILHLLKNGEKCACKLMEELGISQSALSYHMKILCESQVVSCRQEGKWAHYTISNEGIDSVIALLKDISTQQN